MIWANALGHGKEISGEEGCRLCGGVGRGHNDAEDRMSTSFEVLRFMFSQVKEILTKFDSYICA